MYRIRTNQEHEQASFFAMAGHRASLGLRGSQVWLGFPVIREVSPHGTNQRIPERDIRWKYRGSGEWRSLTSTCPGDLVIRVERDQSTLFQTQVSVFPEDFSVRISPKSTTEGRIVLRNPGTTDIHVAHCNGLEWELKGSRTEQIVSVMHSEPHRPERVSLQFRFTGGGLTVVDLPCPTSFVSVTDAAERIIPKELAIPLSRLGDLTLQVFGPKVHIPKLTAGTDGRFFANLRRPCHDNEGVFELPLSTVVSKAASLLSHMDDMDGSAILNVVQAPATEPIYKFSVSRYPGRLEKIQSNLQPDEQEFTDIFVPDNVVNGLRIDPAQIQLTIAPLG